MTHLISVIVPCFNEEAVLKESYRRLTAVLSGMKGFTYELILVDDGSSDQTPVLMAEIANQDPGVKPIYFSRNFGHQIALTAGYDMAKGAAVVSIDADLQDPPAVIPKLIEKWQAGADIVYARRSERQKESLFKRLSAKCFYRFLNMWSDTPIPVDVGDFRLLSRRAVDALNQLPDRHLYLRGMVAWIGFKTDFVDYIREGRFAGVTKYPFRKMLRFALNGVLSFSNKPLKMALQLGFLSIVVGLFLIGYALVSRWVFHETVPGWTSLMIVVVFFGGVQLVSIGILGEYIGRVFLQVKNRPVYITLNSEG